MKILLSPAKSLDFERAFPVDVESAPAFEKEALQINSLLKKKSAKSLQKLMGISDALATLNWERNQNFDIVSDENQKRPAVYAFSGDVYVGLDVYTLPKEKVALMQKQLRILSGLYGILRPLDIIAPYRLEMGTALSVGRAKNLYGFWKEKVTEYLNAEMEQNEILVNLASAEYFGVVDQKNLKSTIVSPQFKDFKDGKLKMISFFAKKARGMMARYIIENNATTIEDLKSFSSEGYAFSVDETKDEYAPVFTR